MNSIHVLIADDEKIVRDGLKNFINWEQLGFRICGDAKDGEEALAKIRLFQPELVLLDIRMPKMTGTELICEARKEGFTGEFIFLSGYSDFKYAQTALQYGAAFYLTKPLDDRELTDAVLSVREKIKQRRQQENTNHQYRKKAKDLLLTDLLLGKEFNPSIDYEELGLSFPVYQVVIYESFTPFGNTYSFAELLKITNQGNDSFEHIMIDNCNCVVLKGDFALRRFQEFLNHYERGAQKGSPLDTNFLAYGPAVSRLRDLSLSYRKCKALVNRRFFCDENQHVLSYEMLPSENSLHPVVSQEASICYSNNFSGLLQAYSSKRVSEELNNLKETLFTSSDDVMAIKHFLADIFLQIKQNMMHIYPDRNIPFPHNAAIIDQIEKKYYLYEILQYFKEQFDLIIRALGDYSSRNVLDDILYYINHNYDKPLKLESIALLFGYNSAYLGKMFTQKIGYNFNTYLDMVRIEEGKRLLLETNLKIYEISSRVGYKSVDYFQLKFHRMTGTSPTEYKKHQLYEQSKKKEP